MEGAWGQQDEGDNPYTSKDDDPDGEPPEEDGTTNEDDDGKDNNSKEQEDVDDRDTNGIMDGITDGSGDYEQKSSGQNSGEKGDDAADTTGLDDVVTVRPLILPLPMVVDSRVSYGTGGTGATGVVKTKEETEMESEDPNTDDNNNKDEDNNDDENNNTKDKASWDDGHSTTGNAKGDDKYFVDQREDDRSDYEEEEEEETTTTTLDTEDTNFISSKGTYFAPNLPQMDPTYRLPNGDIDLELHSEEISPPVLLGVLSILAIAICMLRKPRKFAKGKKPNKIHYSMSGVKREVPVY